MKATAAGTADIHRDRLEGVVAVSPFGAYSDALKSIPLFGTIFSGERQGIATALFNLNGSLKDPQVVYMTKESFKNGLTGLGQLAFDVLKNIVLAPEKVLNGPSKETKSSPNTSGGLAPKEIPQPIVKEKLLTK